MSETSYSVSAAAKLLEVQSHVLRFWEEELHLPINRNELGHRYYTRYDIQVLLAIKELKKKGLALKEIDGLVPFLYKVKDTRKETSIGNPVPAAKTRYSPGTPGAKSELSAAKRNKKISSRKSSDRKSVTRQNYPAAANQNKNGGDKKGQESLRADAFAGSSQVPDAFMEIMDRLVKERMRTLHSGEERYKRLDERIRICQKSRREVAASIEQQRQKNRKIFKKKNTL